MSLKTIHIVFITASVILCFGFGAWELHAYHGHHHRSDLIMGVGSLVCGVALVIYEKAVLRKLRRISYL
jgi:hypothetical protein